MNIRFFAVLLGICLASSSLCAQVAKGLTKGLAKGLKVPVTGVKIPSVRVPKVPLGTRVTAAVRGQTPALQRLTKIRTYNLTVKEWRVQNPVLASKLDAQGVILKKLEADAPASHAFSTDGISWYAADEMLVKAVKEGRPVRFGADGIGRFSLYKNGPEFEFYDEQLFKELDRSLELGLDVVSRNKYVSVQFPKEFSETEIVFLTDNMYYDELRQIKDIIPLKGLNPQSVASYIHVMWIRNEAGLVESPLYAPSEVAEWGLDISKRQGGAVETIINNGQSVKDLNDWFAAFKEVATKLKPYEGRLNIRMVYARTIKNGNKFMLQDSKGALHEVGELEAVVRAEEQLLLPAVRVEVPKIEVPFEADFEEVF